MRRTVLTLWLILLAGMMPALAQEVETDVVEKEPLITRGDRVTFGDRMVIPAGTVHRGSITSLAGELRIEGTVRGDVVAVGGELHLDGTVEGETVAVLCDVSMTRSSRIHGGLVAVAGSTDDQGAVIDRDRVNIPLGLSLPGLGHPLEILVSVFLWWMLLGLILMFFAVLILAALVPERLELLAEEFPVRWPSALFLGLTFCVLGMPLIYILLIISIIGIPLIPFVYFTFVVLKWMGIAGIFLFLGRKLGSMAGRTIPLLPSVLLGFLVLGLIKMIPFVGFLVWLIMGWIGVGIVLLTRFGTRRRHFQPPVTAPPPPPPVEPEPAATPET